MSDLGWTVVFVLLVTWPVWIGPLGYAVLWLFDLWDEADARPAKEPRATLDELLR